MPDKETEEKRRHSTPLIPYSHYQCHLPDAFMNVPMHWHSEFELGYILQGKGEFICQDKRFLAEKGDILLLPPNMLHAAYPCEESSLIYHALVFHPYLLGANSNDRCTTECIRPVINGNIEIHIPIGPDFKDYPRLKSSVEEIFSCAFQNNPSPDLLLKSELLRLFWLLLKDSTFIRRKSQGLSHSEMIRPALFYMMENFRENITVEELADLVHLSKSYFMGCFKKAVGVGAMEHLAQLRINAACEALSATDTPVADIAFACGYSNLSNFNRQFKKLAGCSPREYRHNSSSLKLPSPSSM